MSAKQPWISFPAIWPTEARFITWVRGVLRKGWKNHPVKIEYLNSRKKRIKNNNPKSSKTHPTVWGCECEQCLKDVKFTDIEVDHAGAVQGKFTCMDEIQGYAEHLFLVDFDSLQTVCIPCHQVRSLAQSMGVSFEEAQLEKAVITECKKGIKNLKADLLSKGFSENEISNDEKRRECVRKMLNDEKG